MLKHVASWIMLLDHELQLLNFISFHKYTIGEGCHSAEDGLDSLPELDNCAVLTMFDTRPISDSM